MIPPSLLSGLLHPPAPSSTGGRGAPFKEKPNCFCFKSVPPPLWRRGLGEEEFWRSFGNTATAPGDGCCWGANKQLTSSTCPHVRCGCISTFSSVATCPEQCRRVPGRALLLTMSHISFPPSQSPFHPESISNHRSILHSSSLRSILLFLCSDIPYAGPRG